jgi:hypothetical protein
MPLGAWCGWNLHQSGDLTGAASKIQALGWTHEPWTGWWPHPFFTPRGLGIFWSELMASLWRGAFIWFGQRLASPVMDVFYWGSSSILVFVAAIDLFRNHEGVLRSRQPALRLAFWSFAAMVMLLIITSIRFDFGNFAAPSRVFPFLSAGRLLTGALIPFFLLYLHGLDRVLGGSGSRRAGGLALGGVVLLITVSEIKVNRPVFSSSYNWFHLWAPGNGPAPRHSTGLVPGRRSAPCQVSPLPDPRVSWRLAPSGAPDRRAVAECTSARG